MHLFTTIFLTTYFLPVSCSPILSSLPVNSREVTDTSKAGLTSPSPGAVEVFTKTTNKVSWYYSWSSSDLNIDRDVTNRTLEFVPMLWGEPLLQDFSKNINNTIKELNVTTVLGMNEPQQAGQSNLTPQQGVDMWLTYIQPLKSLGVRLGSPAPSSAPSGMTWLQQFMQLCNGRCSVDFIALHYYDVNATDFKDYMSNFHETFQLPIWVTEWACQNFNNEHEQCSQDDVALFLNSTQSWMDETTWVERYSFFGAGFDNLQGVDQRNAMITTGDQLTDLGKQYIGEAVVSTSGGSADGPPSGGDTEKFDGKEEGNNKGGNKSNSAARLQLTLLMTVTAFVGILGASVVV